MVAVSLKKFFFQAEDGIRDDVESRGLGDVYKRQGVGIYDDMSKAAEKLVKWDTTYVPDMENHKIYCEMYGQWRKVYKAQLDICNQDLTKSMWAAPGL